MVSLELLRADHAEAVLAFERENRDYFRRFIGDRGEAYFEDFDARHAALLADQEAGGGAYFLLVDGDGSVLGRFNLILDDPERAVLGYRVAERAAGRGLATAGVGEVCRLAASAYGVTEVVAGTSHANVASQRVLARSGFVVTGPADPSDIGGNHGSWWRRDL